MCCHLAGPPERLALDPKLHQGLRRKNQLGLVCSSTDYKGLGGFFYLPLWFGPNHGCQFPPLLLGSPPAFIFLFLHTPPLCQTFLFCFSFSSGGFSLCVHLHLKPSLFIPILVADRKRRAAYSAIVGHFYCWRLIIFQNRTPAMTELILIQSVTYLEGSEITKVHSTISPFLGL